MSAMCAVNKPQGTEDDITVIKTGINIGKIQAPDGHRRPSEMDLDSRPGFEMRGSGKYRPGYASAHSCLND